MPGEFHVEITPSLDDIDELNHVSNVVYVRWIQEVAVAHSAAVGWDAAAYRAIGAMFVVRRHEVDYVTPCFAGDQVRLTTWVESIQAASSVRRTRITRLPDGKELARATTQWVFVRLDSGRPRRIPPELRAAFP